MDKKILEAALLYAKKGWPVFPCKPDKSPYTTHGCKDATTEEGQIRSWWKSYPEAMIGVATGNASGIWALDVDVPKKPGQAAGSETVKELTTRFGELPPTLKQTTPSGGEHYIFTIPVGADIKNSVKTLGPGLDVRGAGGYIIISPSQNDTGKYVIINEAEPSDAPDWLLELVVNKKNKEAAFSEDRGKAINSTLHPYVKKALEASISNIATAEAGSRNDTLFKNIATMAGFIASGLLSEKYLHEQATDAYQKCNPEEFAKEFESTFKSAIECGSKTPRQIPDILPPGFRLVKSGDTTGLWYDYFDGSKPKSIRIGAPLFIRGLLRDWESNNWGKLLEWNDPDGHRHLHPFPAELFAGSESSAWRRILANGGYTIGGRRKVQELLAQYICGCQPEKRFIGVDRTGWHNNSFVLPDKTYPETQSAEIILVHPPLRNPYESMGTLEVWRESVCKLAEGNSRLIFAICVALAAPLLHVLGMESGGFNFIGSSSIGKSTALIMAASVWGKSTIGDGYILSWRSTDNALEAQAALHSDTLLCLDELSQAPSKVVNEAAYMLGNNQGKARANRSGNSRQIKNWRIMFLSSGEQGLDDKLREDGRQPRAGQSVRMIDIPADAGAGLGIFENLHGMNNAQKFADMIKSACAKYYGTASRTFIERLIKILAVNPQAIATIFENCIKLLCPTSADAQVKRASQKFALCMTAGIIASYGNRELPILPYGIDEVTNAIMATFHAWLANRGGMGALEDIQVMERAKTFIGTHSSRFESLDSKQPFSLCPNRAGFTKMRDGKAIYYILPQIFKSEICCGLLPQRAAKALQSAGILLTDSDSQRWQIKLPQAVPDLGRPRVYALCVNENMDS